MTLISDSSVVFAALSPRERHHEVCTAELVRAAVTVIPAPVLVEVDWLARSRGVHDVMDRVLGSVGDRSIAVVDLDEEEYRRVRALLRTYADLGLEFVGDRRIGHRAALQ